MKKRQFLYCRGLKAVSIIKLCTPLYYNTFHSLLRPRFSQTFAYINYSWMEIFIRFLNIQRLSKHNIRYVCMPRRARQKLILFRVILEIFRNAGRPTVPLRMGISVFTSRRYNRITVSEKFNSQLNVLPTG